MNEYLDRWLELMPEPMRHRGPSVLMLDPKNWDAEMNAIVARHGLVLEYAWAVPSDRALDAIAALSPIVELGAGGGYWAMLLRERGADVVAYDKRPGPVRSITESGPPRRCWSDVLEGDVDDVARHADRTLLLCWPPYSTPMAHDALARYLDAGGERLVYIGEHHGCNATDEFFELIDRRLTESETIAIPQWPGIHDYLTIYRRKDDVRDNR